MAAIPTLLSLTVTLSEIWLNYVAILGKWVLLIVTLGPSMQCATKKYHLVHKFSDVWTADHFVRKDSISSRVLLPLPPHNGTSSIMFLISGYAQQFIGSIDSRLIYCYLSPQIWLPICWIRTIERGYIVSSYLSQRIIQGHEVWISYFHSLQKK